MNEFIKLSYMWYEGETKEVIISHKNKKKEEIIEDVKKIISEFNKKKETSEFYKCLPACYFSVIEELDKQEDYHIIEGFSFRDEYYVENEKKDLFYLELKKTRVTFERA